MESIRLHTDYIGPLSKQRTNQCWKHLQPSKRDGRTYRDSKHIIVAQSSKKRDGRLKGRVQVPKDSVGGSSKTLDVVETVVLGTAVVSHTMYVRNSGGGGDKDASDARHHEQFLSGCIVASLVLRKLVSGMYEKRRESSPTSQAMLRLRNAETAIEDQVKVMDVVLRDMDALKTRSRLVGRDVKSAVKQMDQTHALTGDVLRDTTARMDMLENKVGDMEGLIGSVHEVVSKQLTLIRNVIQEQKALGERIEETTQRRDEKHENFVTTRTSSSIEDVESHPLKNNTTDEWGRTQPMVSVSAPSRQPGSSDGSILFSFDSN
jgi:hypothetical protein